MLREPNERWRFHVIEKTTGQKIILKCASAVPPFEDYPTRGESIIVTTNEPERG